MKKELYLDSQGGGKIYACQWIPEGSITAIVQIVHGIAEHTGRYDDFARWLNDRGILVVAEDHMGHGKSVGKNGVKGYFDGGWFAAAGDCLGLMEKTMAEYPGIPYFVFGHSMGSFLTRTMLIKKPDCGIRGAVICGTAWQSQALLSAAKPVAKLVCKISGEREPSAFLDKLMFGGYNSRVSPKRTSFDWLCSEESVVDAYIADPLCGFTATAGLARDMIGGISFNQKPENLRKMRKKLPVFFIAGQDDPVGSYGKGVTKAAEVFTASGMERVECKLYPGMRHEILNEKGREAVYTDILTWIQKTIG